jgi:hypothetical protein
MKNTKCLLAFSTVLLFASSCTSNSTEQQIEPAGQIKAESILTSDKYRQATSQLTTLNIASQESGLTALMFSNGDVNAWQKLDAYYQKADALPYPANIKEALKEKAIFALVEMHQFLDKAPLEKRTYYADQFFAQRHINSKLAIAFLENLRKQWPEEKFAVAKAKTAQQLQADMVRATRKLPSNIVIPNLEAAQKALEAGKKNQLKQEHSAQALQEKLAAL